MKSTLLALALGVLLVFGLSGQAQAQEEHYGSRPMEFNIHAGALMLDSGGESSNDTDVLFGVRGIYNMPSGWGFGVSGDYVLSDADVDEDDLDDDDASEDIDVSTFLYSAGVEYTFPSQGRAHFFLGAGVGAATTKLSDAPEGFEDSSTNLMVPVGGGLKYFFSPNMALRVDVRDNIIFAETFDADEEDSTGSEATNNFEFSGGLSFLFGDDM